MAKRKSQKGALFTSRQIALIVLCGVVLAFAVLMAISARCEHPFLPTWEELFDTFLPQEERDTSWQMEVIDVGNADSILFTDGSHHMLIDAGERGDGRIVLAALEKRGIKKLDYVIATHFHADHIGGMEEVIRGVDIGTFLLSYMPEDKTPTTKTYTGMLTALVDREVPVRDVKPGETYTLGDAVVEILGPAGEFDDMNNQSVVCRVTCNGKRFLMMGDAEVQAEKSILMSRADVSADVIKLGHHGSSTSSSGEFLDAVSPTYSVMTCGAGNSYDHPHKETLARVQELGLKNYRSDECGTIVFTVATDGGISVTTERGSTDGRE